MGSQSTGALKYVLEAAQEGNLISLAPITHLDWHPFDILSGAHTPVDGRIYRVLAGQILPDLVYCNDLTLVISERAAATLRSSTLQGWDLFPASVVDRTDRTTSAYGLSVIGHCDVVRAPIGPSPGRFGPSTIQPLAESWDGGDLALVRDTAVVLATEQVRDLVMATGLAGFQFLPVESVEFPF